MASFDSFWSGFIIFVTCCAISFVMAYGGGKLIDEVHQKALDNSLLQGDATANDYQKNTEGTLYLFINFYYFIMYVLPVFGGVIFGQSILKRVRQDRYTYRGG